MSSNKINTYFRNILCDSMFHFPIPVLVCQLVKRSFRELYEAVSTAWHKHDCTDRSCDLRCLLLLPSDAYGSSGGFRPSGLILANLLPICADLPSKKMKTYSFCTVPNSSLPEARDGARLMMIVRNLSIPSPILSTSETRI